MAGTPQGFRASDADRARAVTLLQGHYGAGRLTVEELEERTRQAYAARHTADLQALLADLPPEPAPVVAPVGPPPGPWAPPGLDGLSRRLWPLVGTGLLLVAIWALSGHGYFWPAWPILGCAYTVFFRSGGRRGCRRASRRERLLSRL